MRSFHQLTQKDRFIIQRGRETGKSSSDLAREIGCHRSTICREIKRNSNSKGGYRARGAQAYMSGRRRHIVFYNRKIEGPLEELVRQLLEERLSPEQISCRLKLEKAPWSVSHETIYKWIYNIAPIYKKCLRWRSRCRQKRSGKYRRGLYKCPRKLIDKRPIEANLRTEPGHWERDLLEGRRSSPALLVLQDRCTRYTIIRKVESKHCELVNKITADALKGQVVKTITNDNGIEFGKPQELEKKMSVPIYFCHAYTSWERGTVENTNGLLRQYYPKHFNFKTVTEDEIKYLEDAINKRPRKTLGYRSPFEITTGTKLKQICSESYYCKKANERDEQTFKQDMIREVGYYLEKTGEKIVALNN